MGRKRKAWTARPFESLGERFTDPVTGAVRKDTSSNLFESMLLHPAFTTMKPRQQMLYVIAKAQFYGHRKPAQDFPDIEFYVETKDEEKPKPIKLNDTSFYLNWGLIKRYGLYSKNGQHEFYDDLKELQRRGFIQCVSNGMSTKSKSIYRFMSDWKDWKQDDES